MNLDDPLLSADRENADRDISDIMQVLWFLPSIWGKTGVLLVLCLTLNGGIVPYVL